MTIDADNEITGFSSLTKVAERKLPDPFFIRIKSCLNDIYRIEGN